MKKTKADKIIEKMKQKEYNFLNELFFLIILCLIIGFIIGVLI